MTPSQIAVEAVTNLLAHNQDVRRYELLLASHQSAIDKATEELVKDRDRWKSSHDNQVNLRRALMDRPDLKERAALVAKLQNRAEKAEAAYKQKTMMTLKETEGYELAKGAMGYIAQCLIIGLLIAGGFNALRFACGWGTDDSDKDGWNRSGLKVHKDAKTGIEYLSDRHGGLVRRDAR
jgi:hypothetical protein